MNTTNKPGQFERLTLRLGTFGELLCMLSRSGRWWMLPFVAVLAVTAILLVVVQVIEYAAPFIYTIF
jgi:hypothetical protein